MLSPSLFNSAYAFRPQSVVGRILQFGIQAIMDEAEKYDFFLNVHDEVEGQCRPEDVYENAMIIQKCLMIPHEPVPGKELIIPCDFKVGLNWGEMKEYKTLEDLKKDYPPRV